MATRPFGISILVAAVLGVLTSPSAAAQTRGNTVTQPYQFTFETSGQSMWGPGSAPANIDFRYTLWDLAWNQSGENGDVRTFAKLDFGGRIRGGTRGATGLWFRIHNIETGSVDLVYPVDIVITLPEPNSFRDGDVVTIGSEYALGSGWALNTTRPGVDITFEGRFGLSASSSVDVCLFGCSGFTLVPAFNIPNLDFDVMTLSGAAESLSFPAIPGATVDVLPHAFAQPKHGISGMVDLPRVMTTSAVRADGRTLSARGSHDYIQINLAWEKYIEKLFRVRLGGSKGVGGAEASYELLHLGSNVTFSETKDFEFLPDLELRVVLPMVVDYTIKDENGVPGVTGTSNTILFNVGHSVDVSFPRGMKNPLEHIPTYLLRNQFTSTTTGAVRHDLNMRTLSAGLHVPGKTVTPEVCVLDVCTPALHSPSFDIGLGPLYRQTLTSQTVPLNFYPGATWTLEGIAPMTGDPFFLDPENPIVTVESSFNASVLENTGPPGTLTQTIHIRNDGDVKLSTVALADALQWALWYEDGGAFYIPVDHADEYPEIFALSSITSDHMTLVDDFDGSEILDKTKLAIGNDMLDVGQTATIRIVMTSLHDRLYGADLKSSGVSPIGTLVHDTGWSSLGVFKFDVEACRLPRRWDDEVDANIAGTRLMDVNTVDLSSIRIEGVAPTEIEVTGYEDYGRIWLEFDQDELVDSLRARHAKMAASAPVPVITMERTDRRDPVESIAAADVAEQLLDGTALLDRGQVQAVDELGNKNGQLDLGDLRALLVAQGVFVLQEESVRERRTTDAELGSGDQPVVALSRRHRGRCRPRHGYEAVPAIVTGNFTDGTPFIGEDLINIRVED